MRGERGYRRWDLMLTAKCQRFTIYSKKLSYVEDTKLFMSFRPHASGNTVAAMNEDLVSLRNWCFDNGLLLNPDKTKLIIYGSRQMVDKIPEFRLSLLGKALEPSETVKDLGVTFDKNLTFNEHIIKTVSSCMSALGQISRVKHAFRKEVLTMIINSLVFSKLLRVFIANNTAA